MYESCRLWSQDASFADIDLESLVGSTPVPLLGGGYYLAVHVQIGREGTLLATTHGRALAGYLDSATRVETLGQLRNASLGRNDPWHRSILPSLG